MRLLSLELENYRQYLGKQAIEFSDDPKKNLTVIEGSMGSGKTNLLNALTWCLYGKEEHFRNDQARKQGLINDSIITELGDAREAHAKVRIHGIDSDGRRVIFERRVTAHKATGGRIVYEEPVFQAFKDIRGDMKEITSPGFIINRILPEGIKNFFFFDGEKLDDFFKEENAEKVKQAILDVSQLSLLDTVIDHVEKTLDGIREEMKDVPDIQIINEKIGTLQRSKEQLIADKKEKERLLAEARAQLKEVNDRLRNTDVAVLKTLASQRDGYLETIQTLDTQIYKREEELRNQVISDIPAVLCHDATAFSLKKINETIKKGDLPPRIQETFMSEILERGECICGSDISQDQTKRKRILELLKEESEGSKISEYVKNGKFVLAEIERNRQYVISQLDSKGSDIEKMAEEKQKLQNRINEIGSKIKGIKIEEVTNLDLAYSNLLRNVERLDSEKGVLDAQLEGVNTKISIENEAFKKQSEKSKKHADTVERFKIGDQVLSLYRVIRKNLIDNIRKTIETKTKDYFFSLTWKKKTYKGVLIDENYNVSVINMHGLECLSTLSAGERQILALSFMAALRDVSGFDVPILIDTPLGRISGEPKDNIARFLPQYLENVQMVLLVTDQEYTYSVKKLLSERVGKQYKLDYKEDESKTYVRPYGT